VVPAGAVLVVDGLFLSRDELTESWDLTIYLDVPDDVAIARVLGRDGPLDVPTRYVGAQQLYRRLCAPLDRADLVIDNTDPQAPVIRGDRRKSHHGR
jgi:uridine kinase